MDTNYAKFIKSISEATSKLDLLVDSMFSFDVSAVDIVLVVAVIILLFLFVARKLHASEPDKSKVEEVRPLQENLEATSKTLESENSAVKSPPVENLRAAVETPESENKAVKSQTDIQNCEHSFGYLKNRPKNTSVPEECYGCQKFVECLLQNE